MFKSDYVAALDDYKKARRRAAIQELLARLTGNPEDTQLLSYDDVRHKLQAVEKSAQHLEDIPLDAIVGSVGRYHDFTRRFLPKSAINQGRWARVKATTQGLSGLPPIEVYQIGGVYFVRDGNHRVSVARQMGNVTIQAYVTEVESKVDLPPDVTPDEIIIKGEMVEFLKRTRLDQSIPGINITATKPGAYPTLLEHIAVHRHYMGIEQQREIPFEDSAEHWYKTVFMPVVQIIRQRNLLADFPERTAVDLYLWAADHRASLAQEIGWDIGPEAALSDLSESRSRTKAASIRAFVNKLQAWLTPDALEGGPPTGTWRNKLLKKAVLEHLFNDLIVAVDNSQNAWNALNMAVLIAGIENSRVHGIHIHSDEPDPLQDEHEWLKSEFENRCRDSGIRDFDFKFSRGEISRILLDQAYYADLVILPLNHPPGDKPASRLSSGITTLVRSCPVPLLTVPDYPARFQSLLLAYDGSTKSKEAMYLAAYFGTQCKISLTVLTSREGLNDPAAVQDQARNYLSRYPLDASYLVTDDLVASVIPGIQEKRGIDLLLMGGYGGGSILGVMLGSVLDQVLREIRIPVLICR